MFLFKRKPPHKHLFIMERNNVSMKITSKMYIEVELGNFYFKQGKFSNRL